MHSPDRTSHELKPPTRAIRILHLEDSTIDADLTRAYLEKGQIRAQIDRTMTRAEYVACLTQNHYDVILSDYHLPDFDGIAALELARQHRPETPFIFLSGALGEEVAIEMLKKGATDYVLKQRMTRLPPAVMRALAEASERSARRDAETEREAMFSREKSAREEAETASRIKDEFLAVASHELRTPLNAILGWAAILQNSTDPKDLREGLAVIQRNAKHQAQLIEDILDVSRMIAGRLRISVKPHDLVPIIQRATDTVRPAAGGKGVEMRLALEDVGTVACDSDRIEQVIWNLLSNAIKFTPRGGSVTVTLTRQDDMARLVVCDSGRGIKTDFLPFVFERFRQADASTTRRHGGLGLGLAIVRNIVELHGGTVSAHSDGDGCGATFTVELPIVPDAVATVSPDSDAISPTNHDCPPNLSGLHVLIVDDDRDGRRLLQAILELCNVRVDSASNTAEAMDILRSGKLPDLIVSDIGMPDEDGNAFISRLRSRMSNEAMRDLPAVALTAYTRNEDRAKALSAGFNAFLSKPVEPRELLNVMASLTAAKG